MDDLKDYNTIMKLVRYDVYALSVHASDYKLDIDNQEEMVKLVKEVRKCLIFPDETLIALFEPDRLESAIKSRYLSNS